MSSASFEAGITLLIDGMRYRLHTPAGKRRGWWAVAPGGDLVYLSPRVLSRASKP